jgi:hypothetical protein
LPPPPQALDKKKNVLCNGYNNNQSDFFRAPCTVVRPID